MRDIYLFPQSEESYLSTREEQSLKIANKAKNVLDAVNYVAGEQSVIDDYVIDECLELIQETEGLLRKYQTFKVKRRKAKKSINDFMRR